MRNHLKKYINKLEFKNSYGKKHLFGAVYVIFWVAVFILTIILPSNILDKNQLLRKFVNFMMSIFPAIDSFGKYSGFPQVSQLIYAIEILAIPYFTILFYINLPPDSSKINKKKWLEKPIRNFLLVPTFVFLLMLFPLSPWFEPSGRLWRLTLFRSLFHSKLMFSIGSILFVMTSAFGAYFFVVYFKAIYHMIFHNEN